MSPRLQRDALTTRLESIAAVATTPLARHTAIACWLLAAVAVDPVTAQTVGKSFCKTPLVKTGKNVLTVIQFGGPLLGTILTLGATVTLPAVRKPDIKKELKEIRSQGLVWGVLVAPLTTTMVQFLLNSVVAGGASCGF